MESRGNDMPAPASKTERPCKVLVADDDAPNLLLARSVLEFFGCLVTTVSCGVAARDAMRLTVFDIVFLDIHMPDMSGIQVTEEVRSREAVTLHHVPILAMTASAMPVERAACLAAGMDAILLKPYRLEDVRVALETWCGRTF